MLAAGRRKNEIPKQANARKKYTARTKFESREEEKEAFRIIQKNLGDRIW